MGFFFREISCLFTISDAGGGQYVVNAKHIFTELAAATAESIVLERYGSKALRIFRVVREKLRIEETQLQSLVMIPAKEVKYLTYTLMEGKHTTKGPVVYFIEGRSPSRHKLRFCI